MNALYCLPLNQQKLDTGAAPSCIHCSDDIVWDLTNCIPFWSHNSGLVYSLLKTTVLFIIPLVIMIIFYTKIINKLWSNNLAGSYVHSLCMCNNMNKKQKLYKQKTSLRCMILFSLQYHLQQIVVLHLTMNMKVMIISLLTKIWSWDVIPEAQVLIIVQGKDHEPF